MATTLRLPDALDAAARAKADYLGISLNALVCVALDAYLRGPADVPTPATGAASGEAPTPSKTKFGPEPDPQPEPEPVAPRLTRAQKQAIYEREKAERRRLTGHG